MIIYRKKIIILIVLLILFINLSPTALAVDIELQANSAILMEPTTGDILFEKNMHEQLPIASVTKVMTLLIIMEEIDNGNIKLDDIITASENASSMGGSQIFLAAGEKMTVDDMLKAIAVASGNDASVAMAEHISGSEQLFVNRMNKKAKELSMKDTNFMNCSGLPVEGHYSTAHDIALMSSELVLNHPDIHKWLTIWIDHLREGEKTFDLANTNRLVRFYDGADGIKTGSTAEAKFCLSATAKRDNLRLISVILAAPNSKQRFHEASTLLDYGFASYELQQIDQKSEFSRNIKVYRGKKDSVKLILPEDITLLIEKGQQKDIEKKISIPDSLTAPFDKHQKVGEYTIILNGEKIKTVDIITESGVKKANIFQMTAKFIKKWLR